MLMQQWNGRLLATLLLLIGSTGAVRAQLPMVHLGEAVPRDVREIYDRGLRYLAQSQSDTGAWTGGQQGPGTTGLVVMAFLASGEDPNFGIYASHIRRALQNMLTQQNNTTGFLGNSMYHHGFAMLAFAEAYGAVDDRDWKDKNGKRLRGLGEALELAVRCAITSQEGNPHHAWRYSPNAQDADTSVSGAILVGLLAARNAGIEVPDVAIDHAVRYFREMTSESGEVAYSGIGGLGASMARSSIATLIYAIARRKDLPEFKATLGYLVDGLEDNSSHYAEYTLYYKAQALFQGDVEAWQKWNKLLVRELKAKQLDDGSIPSRYGKPLGTSMSLLSLALNYRFLPIYER